jgi:hypothetical protein
MQCIQLLKRLLATGLFLVAAGHANAALVYQSNFPASITGGPCSPCFSDYRVYDRVTLTGGATNLDRIEFYAHDITSGGIQNVNISIFNNNETLLHSGIFSGANLHKSNYLGASFYTIGIDLPSWAVNDEPLWISIYGVSGSMFGLYAGGGGDGIATQMAGGSTPGFSRIDNLNDVAMRLYGTDAPAQVPEPASLALLGLGFACMTTLRRRKARS